MKKLLFISLVAISSPFVSFDFCLLTFESPPVMAQTRPAFNSPPAPAAGKKSEAPQSFSDIIGFIDSGVDTVNNFFDQTVGQVTGLIGQVYGLFGKVTAPLQQLFSDARALAQLVTKLINFPSTVSGWWNSLVDNVVSQYDACHDAIEGAVTPPFLFEAGWCFGGDSTAAAGGGGDSATGGSSPATADDFELIGHSSPDPAGPAGRKSTSIGDIAKESQGPAGLPVPSLVRYQVDRAVDAAGGDGDRFEVNPTVIKYYGGNRAERGITRLQAESTLGPVGQAKMLEELTGIQQAVAGNFGTAGAAQALNVTQDVMKQMVQMQASETLLLGSLAAGNQQQRIDNAFTHLNLSNIGRTLDEQNRARRIDRTLEAFKVLRTASQARLF
jgi:hypothetical protein